MKKFKDFVKEQDSFYDIKDGVPYFNVHMDLPREGQKLKENTSNIGTRGNWRNSNIYDQDSNLASKPDVHPSKSNYFNHTMSLSDQLHRPDILTDREVRNVRQISLTGTEDANLKLIRNHREGLHPHTDIQQHHLDFLHTLKNKSHHAGIDFSGYHGTQWDIRRAAKKHPEGLIHSPSTFSVTHDLNYAMARGSNDFDFNRLHTMHLINMNIRKHDKLLHLENHIRMGRNEHYMFESVIPHGATFKLHHTTHHFIGIPKPEGGYKARRRILIHHMSIHDSGMPKHQRSLWAGHDFKKNSLWKPDRQ